MTVIGADPFTLGCQSCSLPGWQLVIRSRPFESSTNHRKEKLHWRRMHCPININVCVKHAHSSLPTSGAWLTIPCENPAVQWVWIFHLIKTLTTWSVIKTFRDAQASELKRTEMLMLLSPLLYTCGLVNTWLRCSKSFSIFHTIDFSNWNTKVEII